ncbi:MAG: 2,3-bisphosphoglycerate-independent phosphoglycerate mutase, partial [Acidobacteriota bacterium]
MAKRPVVLTILDGWGYSPETRGNAVYLAKTPTFDMLQRTFPHTLIQTSGEAVGRPAGQMGNSEVGHLNIGAGRVIRMDVTRIDLLVLTGEIYQDPVLQALM